MRVEGDFIVINKWLVPLSWLYGLGVKLRNFAFEELQHPFAARRSYRLCAGKGFLVCGRGHVVAAFHKRRSQCLGTVHPEKAGKQNTPRMKHDGIGAHFGGEAYVVRDMNPRKRSGPGVKARQREKFRMAVRRRYGDGAERVHAAHGNLVQARLEPGDLLDCGSEAQLKRVEAERKRLVGDLLARLEAHVAPIRRKGYLHCGHTILSAMQHKTDSSPMALSLWR